MNGLGLLAFRSLGCLRLFSNVDKISISLVMPNTYVNKSYVHCSNIYPIHTNFTYTLNTHQLTNITEKSRKFYAYTFNNVIPTCKILILNSLYFSCNFFWQFEDYKSIEISSFFLLFYVGWIWRCDFSCRCYTIECTSTLF